jgi:signal transduction histidine kinase/phage shock protein PspC (stress-responsive transcriptional regulator)
MSLMATPAWERDHGGMADAPDPGTRPLEDGGRPNPDSTPPVPPGPLASFGRWSDPNGNGRWSADGTGHWSGEYGWRGRSHRHPGGPGHQVVKRLRRLHRSPDDRVLGGVCGALADSFGIDVTWVRIGFVILSIFAGVTILPYAVAWLLIPMEGESSSIFSRAVNDRAGIRMLIALVPLMIVAQITVSALHLGYLGLIGWPTILALGLGVLIWRNAGESERTFLHDDIVPLVAQDTHGRGRRVAIIRVVAGVLVGLGGLALIVLNHKSTAAALRPVGGAALVIVAVVVIFGPWWFSLVRDLIAERQARALAEERAEMAAHVHDSVLQTLALIQRTADDPQNVTRLARAQERELRAWLFEGRPPGAIGEDACMLAEGLALLQRQVEADHGIDVQVVTVGDCELDEALRALLDAAREATVNAAKWSGADQVSLYAEVEGDTVMLYVRDRGRGFDPDAVPEGRQGIAQSIRARMARFGGTAVIRSAPGEGAEVQLSMPPRARIS